MQQSVLKASRSGLSEPRKEEEWGAGVVHFVDDEVSELPQSPNCPSLIELYLQGNCELIAIPPLFFQRMALLQVLDLSHTSIKSLPKSLPKLVALKKLLLRGCELFMELSPHVGKLRNLEELDLDQTQIMDLPREIGKLLNLKHLRVSFYPICGKKKSKSNIVIHPETISILSQLAELSIDVNPEDKRWDDSVEAVVKEVCNSKALRILSLYLPDFQLLDSILSVIYPSLSGFRFIVGHQKRRIISRVPQEVEAEFRNWDKCLKFVNGDNIPIEIKGVLKYSTSFFLDRHATAMNLSEFGIENMKRLKFCLLAECNKMETIIDGETHYDGNEDDRSESVPSFVEHVLDSLEYLSIYYMENLGSIWRGSNRYGCMSKLKFLALHSCPQLIHIFSHTLLENFVNLEELILEDCPLVISLVSHPSIKQVMPDKFFPSLKRLLLLYLPELVSICNGLLIAPKLESIGFYNCPKLKSISKMELSSKVLKIIKGERQWWEDMNWNETEWGNRPDYLARIFYPISNEKDVMTQLTEDRDLFEVTMQNEDQQLAQGSSTETNDKNSNCSSYTGSAITLWEESARNKGKTGNENAGETTVVRDHKWQSVTEMIKSFEGRAEDDAFEEDKDFVLKKESSTTAHSKDDEKLLEVSTQDHKCQSFMEMIKSAKGRAQDDDFEEYKDFVPKKESSTTTHSKDDEKLLEVSTQDHKCQSFMEMIKPAKGRAQDDDFEEYKDFVLKKESSTATHSKDDEKFVKVSKCQSFMEKIKSAKGSAQDDDFEEDKDFVLKKESSTKPHSKDYTEGKISGTDATMSTPSVCIPPSTSWLRTSESMGERAQRSLINELTNGRGQARQLQLHLNMPSSHANRLLPQRIHLEKILTSYEKALSLLNCNTSLAAEPQPSGLAIRISESQPPRIETPPNDFPEPEL